MPLRVPVQKYMSRQVHTVTPTTPLDEVNEVLEDYGVSGLAVVDETQTPIGVITRTDLFHFCQRSQDARSFDGVVRDAMRGEIIGVAPTDDLGVAALLMSTHRIHRVFVIGDDQLVGVLSTTDVMRAVADLQVDVPLGDVMSRPVMSIHPRDALGLAASQLEDRKYQGLVVVEDGQPVGIISQRNVLAARNWPRYLPVKEWMDLRMLSLPIGMAVHRAATHALALHVRHVLGMDNHGMRGLLTGIDFARALTRQTAS